MTFTKQFSKLLIMSGQSSNLLSFLLLSMKKIIAICNLTFSRRDNTSRGVNLLGYIHNTDTPKNETYRYDTARLYKRHFTLFLSMFRLPSALESSRLGVKSWLWRIFSTTSSASTRVSSILLSWDSMESCFTGCLGREYRRVIFRRVWPLIAESTVCSSYWIYISLSAKQGCGQPVRRRIPAEQLEIMPVFSRLTVAATHLPVLLNAANSVIPQQSWHIFLIRHSWQLLPDVWHSLSCDCVLITRQQHTFLAYWLLSVH